MASMKYHKDCRKWRVFWHVTLPDGTVDKGSRSFKDKALAQRFKEHCENRAKQLKRAIFVDHSVRKIRLSEKNEVNKKIVSDTIQWGRSTFVDRPHEKHYLQRRAQAATPAAHSLRAADQYYGR